MVRDLRSTARPLAASSRFARIDHVRNIYHESGFDPVATFRGLFYGWKIVGIAVFMLTLMALTIFQGLGTFLVAMERQFGWSRTALSGAFVLARAEGAVLGPLEGWLIDKLGNRRMILIGYVIMGIGFLLFSQVDKIWQFYAVFMVINLGSGLGGWLAMISLVNNWFVRKRSLAIATAMSGIHVAGFMIWILALGIENHGFRWTTAGIGVFLLAIIGPVSVAIRNRPEDMGLRPDGGSAPGVSAGDQTPLSEDNDEPEFTARQALRTRAFWAITVVHLSSSISITTLALHLTPKLTDMGFSLTGAAVIPFVYTAIALPSQFVASYLADRYTKPVITFVFLTFQATSILVIALAETPPLAFVFAVLYGIGFGGRIPLLTAIRSEYFGRKSFATIMGLSQMPNNITMMFAPVFAGFMYDLQKSYLIPFATFAIMAYLGAVLMLTVKKPELQPTVAATEQKTSAD